MAALMCLLMVSASIPQFDQTNTEFAETSNIFQSNSDISVTFSNGPSNGQSLTGVYTLSFSISGSNTVASLVIEISDDGQTWTNIASLTDSPWVTYLDTTSFNNGSYQLRATAHDSTVSEDIIEITPSFTIANQVP
ncbi:MAG: Ig-like domain-containing protein, partial [Candidatus Thermoplasmatota archaeon]|nr:Ig-like domain-containing protein [Candidatus Thermoplasmatota archaeon]